METATFSVGCFWSPENKFSELSGVLETTVGYSGGFTKDPTYEEVSSGETGHSESVMVKYDPTKILYEELLNAFWEMGDIVNKKSVQYQSIIFTHTDEQRTQALFSKDQIEKKLGKEVLTEIKPAETFYKAEEYHQKYLQKENTK